MSKKIIVKSVSEGFRRAGHAFTRDGVVLDTADLTAEQLEAIQAERMLVVADYVDPDAAAKPAAAEKPAKAAK